MYVVVTCFNNRGHLEPPSSQALDVWFVMAEQHMQGFGEVKLKNNNKKMNFGEVSRDLR